MKHIVLIYLIILSHPVRDALVFINKKTITKPKILDKFCLLWYNIDMEKVKAKIENKLVDLYISDTREVFSSEEKASLADDKFEHYLEEYNLERYPESERLSFAELDENQIPKGIYCYAEKTCPYSDFRGTVIYHRKKSAANEIAIAFSEGKSTATGKVCPNAQHCKRECWSEPGTNCKDIVVGCKYLGFIDNTQSTLLWDQVKECDVNDDIDDEE